MRQLMASNKGSLMELGVSPIITSGLVLQLMQGSKLIEVNNNLKQDRQLFQGTTKLLGLCITLGSAGAYVLMGNYGAIKEIGWGNAILIVSQLFAAGTLVILLDELLTKGYGLGSGISLFIGTNSCETVIWKAFSPTTINAGSGSQMEGAILALFHLLMNKADKGAALVEAFTRTDLPNLCNLIATVFVFCLVVYFQGWRVDLQVKYQKYRGQSTNYPIKLFYTSNMPIILSSALISNLYFISSLLHSRYSASILVRLLGCWDEKTHRPIAGIAWLVSPPDGVYDAIIHWYRTIIYALYCIFSCAWFSTLWIDICGSSSRDIAKQFRDQGMVVKGHRDMSTKAHLDRYIPVAAGFGGACIGALQIISDFTGAIGSGTGILLAVTIIYQYYEMLSKEGLAKENMMVE